MTAKLTKELSDALRATDERGLEVVDPETSHVYFIVDEQTHRQAMDAPRRQSDRDAITQGLAEMEAGQGTSVAEARESTRRRLLSREP